MVVSLACSAATRDLIPQIRDRPQGRFDIVELSTWWPAKVGSSRSTCLLTYLLYLA